MKQPVVSISILFLVLILVLLLSINMRDIITEFPAGAARTKCTDSDGGLAYNVYGYVTDASSTYYDTCIDGKTLKEYYCSGVRVKYTTYTCPDSCFSGRCVQTTTCTAGWKCKDASTKGYQNTDCTWTSLTNCPTGCVNGECNPVCTAGWKCKDANTKAYQNTDCTWTSLTACPTGCTNGACNPLYADKTICTSNSQCVSNFCSQDLDLANSACCSNGACWHNAGSQCLANGYETNSQHTGPEGYGYYICTNGMWKIKTVVSTVVKGMRFDPSYYYGKGYTAKTLAAKIVTDAQTNGVNTIFIHAYNSVYGAFYTTSYQDTAIEQGFGIQNMLGELITAAHAKNIKVVAWLPVNNFKKVWDNHADWREKKKDGTDYNPVPGETYFLSPLHEFYQSWYSGLLNDLLTNCPGLDGIEAGEGVVDWNWDWTADYNPVANQKYFAAYPNGQLGDANWKIFRASGMTRLHEILTWVAHVKGKKSYVVQTWSVKPDGHLMTSAEIRDGSGFDFDGIMNLADKPDFMIAELIWQQWASTYSNPTLFTPDWTLQAKNEFMANVNSRTNAVVHVELSTFGSYTPTNAQFQTSLQHAITGTQGADFYDSYQAETKGAWPNIKAVYVSTSGSSSTAVYGVTIDAIDHLSDITTSLSRLSKKPTTRIVFDEWQPATNYQTAVDQIHGVSYIMGELLDSAYVSQYTTAQYTARTQEYLNAFGSTVDIWEVGNEINGEWLGTTTDVVAKMSGAYDIIKQAGKKTSLTLYHNDDGTNNCYSKASNSMFTWAQNNVPDRMKQGLDYVLVSFYDNDCPGVNPNWETEFQRLGTMFPNSKIGFGEVGTSVAAQKEEFINRYYKMQINHPRYIGGYFWWYYKQDMVPYTKTLWTVLNNAIAG